jgi:septum site-determining protein MinC
MPSPSPSRSIGFHNTSLGAILISLTRADPAGLADDMHKMLGGRPDYFNHEAAILDFAAVGQLPERIDWNGLLSLLRRYRLQPIGIRNLPGENHAADVRRLNLAVLDHITLGTTASATPLGTATRRPQAPVAEIRAREVPQPAPATVPAAGGSQTPTLYIDRVVRSGQQIYAQGSDLVLLAGSSPGSEVISDGNIHCFGPLAGRALAGARGDTNARIIATCFGPELVAVAGVYRTFERGVPEPIAGRAVVVRLRPSPKNQSIVIEPLQID